MQIVNNTDETLTLEPGEGMSLPVSTIRQFESKPYRVVVDSQGEVVDAEQLINPTEARIEADQ